MTVPESVIAGPPGVRVLVPMMYLELVVGVRTAPSTVIGAPGEAPGEGPGVGRATAVPSMTMVPGELELLPAPADGKLRTAPDMVTGAPPGVSVVSSATTTPAVEVIGMPEIVITAGPLPDAPLLAGVGPGRAMVVPPMATAVPLGLKETVVPEMTVTWLGSIVLVPMTIAEV